MKELDTYIAIEGPIGVGKTSLAERIADKLNARKVFEQFEENPFLKDFYENKNILNEHQNSSLRFNKFMVSKFEDASMLQNISKYSQFCLFFIISLLHLLVYKNLNFGLKKNG